jgi:hypothetical protein
MAGHPTEMVIQPLPDYKAQLINMYQGMLPFLLKMIMFITNRFGPSISPAQFISVKVNAQ